MKSYVIKKDRDIDVTRLGFNCYEVLYYSLSFL
jgi:hypothetical protein